MAEKEVWMQETFLVMARSKCVLGNGELKQGLREVFGVEGPYSPSRGWLGLGWRDRLNRVPEFTI